MQTTGINCMLLSYIIIKTYRIPPNSGPGTYTQKSLNNPVALSEIS
jgi:hypothetical protein